MLILLCLVFYKCYNNVFIVFKTLGIERKPMRRVPDSQRLEHRVTVNMTAAQWETLNAEANGQGLAPSVIARQAFVRGLELLQGEGELVTSGEPVNRETERQVRQPRTNATALKQKQADLDALCLPHLREATGLKDAARRLEAAGILTPTGRTKWNRVSIWRICQRHGVSYIEP